jgi:hypothetical protein
MKKPPKTPKSRKPRKAAPRADKLDELNIRISRRTFLAGTGAAFALAGCQTDLFGLGGDDGLADGPKDTQIASARIHPAIGVARVGVSEEFYLGPETIHGPPVSAASMRDASHNLKRQAARFRIYGYNKHGEVVRELTTDEVDVTWSVHLANKKAAWYRFLNALDFPEAEQANTACPRRNPGVPAEQLTIDAGKQPLSVADRGKVLAVGGTFGAGKVPVRLGDLRIDNDPKTPRNVSRLIVAGGFGKSASPSGRPPYEPTDPMGKEDDGAFNNAKDWYDDISDGPVTAEVKWRKDPSGANPPGKPLDTMPAWVIVAPPNFAPDIVGWRTLYDLLTDLHMDKASSRPETHLPDPGTTSFQKDILPMLKRLSGLQWVNKGFHLTFGKGPPDPGQKRWDFEDQTLLDQLRNPAGDKSLRQQVYNAFRQPGTKPRRKDAWPYIYGDAYGSFDANAVDNDLAVSKFRADHLQRWLEGNFVDEMISPPPTLEALPIAQQPGMLDRAALDYCLADAFHPGCEVTWPVRHDSMYMAPYRIALAAEGDEVDPGATDPNNPGMLTAANVTIRNGPIYAQRPGGLTRWMAVPWQGDTAFCRSGYDADNPLRPTFWPARVPNHVLARQQYLAAIRPTLSNADRKAAFDTRKGWLDALGNEPDVALIMNRMIGTDPKDPHPSWSQLGIVERVDRVVSPNDKSGIPKVCYVESLPANVPSVGLAAVPRGIEPPKSEADKKAMAAGFPGGERQREAFKNARFARAKRKSIY